MELDDDQFLRDWIDRYFVQIVNKISPLVIGMMSVCEVISSRNDFVSKSKNIIKLLKTVL